MTKFDPCHKFIKSYSCVLSYKKILSEISFRIFLLKQFNEIIEHLLMELLAN